MVKMFGYSRMPLLAEGEAVESERQNLIQAGCEPDLIVIELLSVSAISRPGWSGLRHRLSRGDRLVIPSFRRLAKDLKDLAVTLNELHSLEVTVLELSWGIDTASAEGRQFVVHLVPLVSFESQLLMERQREGIDRRKARGQRLGRSATARQKTAEVLALRDAGLKLSEIAMELSVGVASVSRIIRTARDAGSDGKTSAPKSRKVGGQQ